MMAARGQAEQCARTLPANEGRPPFLIVGDVGHSIALSAEFSRTGGAYVPFPDSTRFRIPLRDLEKEEVRELLRTVWTDSLALDPTQRSARITREIAERLAHLAKSLEASGHKPERVAVFLMRAIFTMFAEDVQLVPKSSFTDLLESMRGQVNIFPYMVESLWRAMAEGSFSPTLRQKLLRLTGLNVASSAHTIYRALTSKDSSCRPSSCHCARSGRQRANELRELKSRWKVAGKS